MAENNNVFYMVTPEQLEAFAQRVADIMSERRRSEPIIKTLTCEKSEAAEKIGVTRATIYKMIEDGRLKATSDGKRVVTESITEYLIGQEKAEKEGRKRRGRKKSYV